MHYVAKLERLPFAGASRRCFFRMPREIDGMGGLVYVKEDESSKCPLLPASKNWGFLNLPTQRVNRAGTRLANHTACLNQIRKEVNTSRVPHSRSGLKQGRYAIKHAGHGSTPPHTVSSTASHISSFYRTYPPGPRHPTHTFAFPQIFQPSNLETPTS